MTWFAAVLMDRKHILVVGGEKELQRILSLTLRSENFLISTVDDCAAAAEKISASGLGQAPIGMMLVDTGNYDMGCENVAEQLDQIELDIPVVALVRYGDEEKVNQEFRRRCALIISKPVESAALLGKINVVFQSYRSIKEKGRVP